MYLSTSPQLDTAKYFKPNLLGGYLEFDVDLSQSQLQSLSSCVICCQLYERHRHVSSAVCRHHLSKLLNQKQSRPSPAVAQRQVVAVGAMCPRPRCAWQTDSPCCHSGLPLSFVQGAEGGAHLCWGHVVVASTGRCWKACPAVMQRHGSS